MSDVGAGYGMVASGVEAAPVVEAKKSDSSQTKINFGPNANVSAVSDYSLSVVRDLMAASDVKELTISSSARTPQDQARAMFNKIKSDEDLKRERAQYGPAGQAGLDAYEAGKKAKLTNAEIQSNMADAMAKAKAEGKEGIDHVSDPAVKNVIDISERSIPEAKRPEFENAIKKDSRIDQKRFFRPPKDKDAYHLEIPQPTKK